MRTNLILHFHCSKCGDRLELCNSEVPPPRSTGIHTPEPTGAECLYPAPIYIEPCRTCLEKHTGPARRLMAALNELRGPV